MHISPKQITHPTLKQQNFLSHLTGKHCWREQPGDNRIKEWNKKVFSLQGSVFGYFQR